MSIRDIWVTGLAIAFCTAGCGSDDSKDSDSLRFTKTGEGETVEVVSYWSNPGDAQALQALLDVHKGRHPDDQVIHAPVSNPGDLPALLAERIASGKPPDVSTLHGQEVPTHLKTNGTKSLYPLNEFLEQPSQTGVLSNLYPEFVADVTVDGKIYAIPIAVVRTNTLFYNKRVFSEHQLNPPTTIAEFRTVCQTLKAAGMTTPVGVLIMQPFLHDLVAGVMGVDAYYSYMTGGAPDETALRNAIDLFAEVLDNYVDPHSLQGPDPGLDQELNAFMSGKTAMFPISDWLEGVLLALGWTPGVDYGIIPHPGNAGLFTYMVDTLSIMGGAPHLQGALNLLDSVASLDGQVAFDLMKNTTPARKDVDVSLFTSERRGILQDLQQAEHRLAVIDSTGASWDSAIYAFAQSTPHDKEALLQVLMTTR